MSTDSDPGFERFLKLDAATKLGKSLFAPGQQHSDQLNRGIDHIRRLLEDATVLFLRSSYATSLFLSISAIEETAKLMVTMFRSQEDHAAIPRRRDDLYRHSAKHLIALQEVLLVGGKLDDAIGAQRVREIFSLADDKCFDSLRQSALYMDSVGGQFVVPGDTIDAKMARDVLLIAIECANDHMTGFTSHSFGVGEMLDALFGKVRDA